VEVKRIAESVTVGLQPLVFAKERRRRCRASAQGAHLLFHLEQHLAIAIEGVVFVAWRAPNALPEPLLQPPP